MADGTDEYSGVEESDSIEICRGWRDHAHESADMTKGFLGKGYSKYAFLVRLNSYGFYLISLLFKNQGRYHGKDVCVLQCGTHMSTIHENKKELLAELRLLQMGGWFSESFHRRATAEHCTVPCMSCNFHFHRMVLLKYDSHSL